MSRGLEKNANRHYSIASNKSYSIIQVAKMFGGKIVYIPERKENDTSPQLLIKIFHIRFISV